MHSTTVVLTSSNPYDSRTLSIERDEVSSVAYLRDPSGTVCGAVWLANHGPAPSSIDQGRLNAGLPPVMPRRGTRRPWGTPPPDPTALRVLWFEEGDGVAVYENNELLAVIPGWADVARGMPGYARDAVGEYAFAWSLSEALEGLAPRVAKAQAYWEWREAEGSWASFLQFAMSHLDSRLGPPARFWDVSGGRFPAVGVSERRCSFSGSHIGSHIGSSSGGDRDYTVLSTIGMSCQRMPCAERFETDLRVELALATRQDPEEAVRLLLWLAQYPWRSVTWLGHGHTARWYHDPGTFPLGEEHHGVIMLDRPPGFSELPDLSGFTFGGDRVRWLWLAPLTESELQIAAERGHEGFADRLAVRAGI